ncbi:MAG TPA: urea ABC transporter substrate-binding protein [Vicinamibacteria bacterium]|nr:urea ABC transporter substrate-binding protein [Vicinamibacteria bacterium]
MNKKTGGALALLVVVGLGALYLLEFAARSKEPIRVGLLHSFTGTMKDSESAVADAVTLAIEEINAAGGLLGRPIVIVRADGRSDESVFAREAETLITEEKVAVLFGCWTSASRKAVRRVVEANDHLLFYPLQYEGMESSPNIVYTGAAPNQQIVPAVKWSLDTLGRRVFLVGSDYIFPRMANVIIDDLVSALRGEVVGEEYLLLGSNDVEDVVRKIQETRPDVIFNTINGSTNVAFFGRLREVGITPAEIPTVSFSIAEQELVSMGGDVSKMAGDYAAWNYFQSLPIAENKSFVRRFKDRFGVERVTSDPLDSAYSGVHLWANAVRDAQTEDVAAVRRAVMGQSYRAPGGIVYVDAVNQHTWKVVRIGKILEDGQFGIEWSSEEPVRPIPFPFHRSRSDWLDRVESFYRSWGERWANPRVEP